MCASGAATSRMKYFSTAVSGASGRLYSPAEPLTVGVSFGVSLH